MWKIVGLKSGTSRTCDDDGSYSQHSQSAPSLAVSGDFFSDLELPVEDGGELVHSAPSTMTSSSTSISPTTTATAIHSTLIKLSWLRRYCLIPSFGIIFLAALPFLQGCMYSLGYRMGTRLLRRLLSKG